MTHPNDATLAQMRAARPDASTWLSANAGSGKTRVLTDRVARLLLDGVEPQRILCLTYTKAAASEMQNRLFKRLGEWAMLPDTELETSLRDLGAEHIAHSGNFKHARTLFARAIETPGGLKIQTIHSFCSALLRRFPLEAKVSPQFKEIEDRAADLLRAELVDDMASGADAQVIAQLAQHYTGAEFAALTRDVIRNRDGFANPRTWADICTVFGIAPHLDEQAIAGQVFLGGEAQLLAAIIPPMLEKGKTDEKDARKLETITGFDFDDLPLLETVFLTGAVASSGAFKAKAGSVPTKPTQTKIAEHLPALDAFMKRIEAAREDRVALMAARKTFALHQFASRFIPLYEKQKQLRGWLDFDDLIQKARQLLTDPQVAAWVLYRIDGGIDHILVDEAQDTSPAQWDVIRKLAAEFSSGHGARPNIQRTIFVVGDKKQSIYSFQGADPSQFDKMENEFEIKLTGAGLNFQSEVLAHSFRSSTAILRLVDRVFDSHQNAGFISDNQHIAFKSDLPGRVDLWPRIEPSKADGDTKWSDPLDRLSPKHHTVTLAYQIADEIKRMIDNEVTLPDETNEKGMFRRPVRAGDFLILVQRRSDLFAEIIRACKSRGLPIAGADRLKVGAELAVRDLAALLSFLAASDDSLSLATALKSPLFGWSEQALFTLAHHRRQDHLWQELRYQAAKHPQTMNILTDLRSSVDFLRPYDLIERILTRHGGRRKLLARLGPEAEDGINALLSQALAYEQTAVPSLTGFLVWMQTDDLEIKRQVDSGSDQIRVMTVHGAKGLESPIVILPDTGRRDIQIKDDILEMEDMPVWKTSSTAMPRGMVNTIDERKQAEVEERLRLLYVALTRAEKWLIVACCGDLPKAGSWYQLVEAALRADHAQILPIHGGEGLRAEYGDWQALPLDTAADDALETRVVDPCFSIMAPPIPDRPETLAPSDLGGAKALPGDAGLDEAAAKSYGTRVHQFLDHLAPHDPADWSAVVQTLSDGMPEAAEAANEAQAVLRHADLAHLFTPDTLGEVSITAKMGVHKVQGSIDRLIVTPDRVLAVDFKTNRTVPERPEDTPLGLLRQMGAYAHALEQIYPGRQIETAIVWTRTCQLMYLPHDSVRHALQSTPYLDDPVQAP